MTELTWLLVPTRDLIWAKRNCLMFQLFLVTARILNVYANYVSYIVDLSSFSIIKAKVNLSNPNQKRFKLID